MGLRSVGNVIHSKMRSMYDGWFKALLQHRLQICTIGGTTSKSGEVSRCASLLLNKREGLYRLVTVFTHGDFVVLPHWNTKPPAR